MKQSPPRNPRSVSHQRWLGKELWLRLCLLWGCPSGMGLQGGSGQTSGVLWFQVPGEGVCTPC